MMTDNAWKAISIECNVNKQALDYMKPLLNAIHYSLDYFEVVTLAWNKSSTGYEVIIPLKLLH